jgi:hypothetical protein
LIPNPIGKVLSTLRKHRIRSLLMGGQACILYGAAEFSRDIDIAILASEKNLELLRAVQEPAAQARGDACTLACAAGSQQLLSRPQPHQRVLHCDGEARLGQVHGEGFEELDRIRRADALKHGDGAPLAQAVAGEIRVVE